MSKTAEKLPIDLFLAEQPEVAERKPRARAAAISAPHAPPAGEAKDQVTIYLPPGDHLRLEEARIELLRRGRGRVTKSDIAAAAIRLATADIDKLISAL